MRGLEWIQWHSSSFAVPYFTIPTLSKLLQPAICCHQKGFLEANWAKATYVNTNTPPQNCNKPAMNACWNGIKHQTPKENDRYTMTSKVRPWIYLPSVNRGWQNWISEIWKSEISSNCRKILAILGIGGKFDSFSTWKHEKLTEIWLPSQELNLFHP